MKVLLSLLFLAYILGLALAEKKSKDDMSSSSRDMTPLEFALASQPRLVIVELGRSEQSVKVTQTLGDLSKLFGPISSSSKDFDSEFNVDLGKSEKSSRHRESSSQTHREEQESRRKSHHEETEERRSHDMPVRDQESRQRSSSKAEEPDFKLDEDSKNRLLYDKSRDFAAEKQIEWHEKNPVTKHLRECFKSNLKEGDSIDIVIDLAPSPNSDKLDKLLSQSPLTLYTDESYRDASKGYFSAVEVFVEAVTLDIDAKFTHTVLVHNGRKFYIRGRSADEKWDKSEDFKDEERNLKTLWPSNTKTVSQTPLKKIVKNHLGHMTKLALWNRANGLPVVLRKSRRSKPVYTVVITDGASGTPINDLTDDLERTTVIDLGNRRFLKNLSSSDRRKLDDFFATTSPIQLPLFIDSVRTKACLFASHRD